MAFSTRCPECSAKLAFDEAPDADEAIECPRCGHRFEAATATIESPKKKASSTGDGDRPRKKKNKKSEGGAKTATGVPKKRRMKEKKSNPFLLWIMIIGGLLVAPGVGWVFYKLFFSTGKIGQLMTYVPPECNILRGIDVTRMSKYPGFKLHLETAMKGPFQEILEGITKAAGATLDEAGKPPYVDYILSAKNKRGAAGGTLYIIQTREPYDPKKLFMTGLGGSEQQVDGNTYYKLPGSAAGVFANALVYCPTEKIIVMAAQEDNSMGMLKASIAAKVNPKETSITPKLGATGNKVSRANIWTLMRAEGDLVHRIDDEIAVPISNSLTGLSQKVKTSKTFGVYLYFGNKIKYGVAMDCDSRESADGLVKTMKEGPMGKQDDSEIPRDLGMAFSPARSNNKDFVEFLSTLIYNSKAECAFLEATMSLEKSAQIIGFFLKPDMFEVPLDPSVTGRGR